LKQLQSALNNEIEIHHYLFIISIEIYTTMWYFLKNYETGIGGIYKGRKIARFMWDWWIREWALASYRSNTKNEEE
jgi:hypothetical protein